MKNYKKDFQVQRWLAKNKRGVEWNLTYEEWLDIWSDKIYNRGKGIGKYNMCRVNDTGPYEVGNVFIGLHEDNANSGNHKSKFKPVIVEGKKYNAIFLAEADTGIHGSTIQYRIKAGKKGYSYV